ncbi:MAG TPA: tetratricopeptide repeat protein [Thermoanaerobaculia bacterium]|nr:tetratricopeptide repeat protein [Thermoanaerobaculia bacterium]
MKKSLIRFAALLILLCSCADMATPPPAVTPTGDDRYLIDPRIGFAGTASDTVQRRFDAAWRHLQSGNLSEARRRLSDLRAKNPSYLPALLAQAALELKEGNREGAAATVESVLAQQPEYTAAEVYSAEIALWAEQTRRALQLYQRIARRPEVPESVRERIAELERRLFDELFGAARTAPPAEAIRLLREALVITPAASAARLLLVEKLIETRAFDDARRALEPLIASEPDRSEVQRALAEIDAGRGKYEEAIARYERLARRDARFRSRLDELKQEWVASNMPPQFQMALESATITRADFAVLLYWKVSSVRFAQNIGAPFIAVDIDVPGREELIRAIALGIFPVDPVTRRVYPASPVSAAAASRLAARVLQSRGAPCSRQVASGGTDVQRTQRILAACNVADPAAGQAADAPVSGRAAAALFEQVERAISR